VRRVQAAGFDGFATYDPAFEPDAWLNAALLATRVGMPFSFSVNPGLDEIGRRGLPPESCLFPRPFVPAAPGLEWSDPVDRERAHALSAQRIVESLEGSLLLQTHPWFATSQQGFFLVFITSFNEWHEGHQFEPMKDADALTAEERREILRGMILTRAVDNRLKQFFVSSEIRYKDVPFQGKGFRSLGQEAIYAAAVRLRRGPSYKGGDGRWQGDVIAPLIRDLGAALAMRPEPATIRMALNAQMAKAGPPLDGKDLNIGDFAWGILPPTAPLGIATLTIAGLAMALSSVTVVANSLKRGRLR